MIEPADAQGLNRLLAEGDVRLRRSREAIKNDPRRPAEWETITPVQLQPAIEHLRKEFQSEESQLSDRAEYGCYLALHPDLATEPFFKSGQRNLIPVERRAGWQKSYLRRTEPAIFKFWCDQFSEELVELIIRAFNRFLEIGLAQKSILSMEPVEWAKNLVGDLLYSLNLTLPGKIKEMCDEHRNRSDFANEYFLAYCAWVYWRAPRFVHMQPSGNTPYDSATAWEREDEDTTESLLRGLTERILDPAMFKIDDLAGEAYVALASTPPAEQRPAQAEPTISQAQQTPQSDDTEFPDVEIRNTGELPAKKLDMSNYFDQAQLTDRQRECASLKYEYGLTVTAIAARLRLSRKTVDEYLAAADKKIQYSRARDSAQAHRSRSKPSE